MCTFHHMDSKDSWHSCPRPMNASNKNTTSMHHPQRWNMTTLLLDNSFVTSAKILAKMVNSTDLPGSIEEEEVEENDHGASFPVHQPLVHFLGSLASRSICLPRLVVRLSWWLPAGSIQCPTTVSSAGHQVWDGSTCGGSLIWVWEGRRGKGKRDEGQSRPECRLVGCLLNVPETCQRMSGAYLLRRLCVLPHEIEVTDQTFYLTQSQYTTSNHPSADPMTPGAWQGSHWSTNV